MRGLKKAYVEITNMCNKKCSFCHGTKRAKRQMSTEEFSHILQQLTGVTEYIYLHVLGEPLLHPKVLPFVKMAKERGFKVTLTTNGTMLSEEHLLEELYKLQVSLHSFEDEDEVSHREYLTRIISLSKVASQRGILVSLRLWNLNTNVSNVLAEKMLEEAFPKPWAQGRDGSFTLEKGIYLSYAHRFQWPDMSHTDVSQTGFCYGLRDQIAILADGTVVPCCLDAEGDIPLGNIFTQPLAEIMDSPKAKAIYDGFSQRKAVAELCKRCSYSRRF